MTTVAKLTPEQRAEIRAHAERGDIDGVMRHLDCDGVLELLDALDERDRLRGDVDRLLRDQVYDVTALRGELAAMTTARDEACEIAMRVRKALYDGDEDRIGELRKVGA